MTGRIVVVGDVATDVVARLEQAPDQGSDAGARVLIGGGGSGANVAWWLARQGVGVTLAGRVGDDADGRERARELRAAGVDTQLAVDPRRRTGAVVVVVDPSGERTMFPDRGANLALAATDVDDGLLRGAAHLHLSGYALLDPGPRPAALDMLGRARALGLTTSVDPASTGPLRRAGPERFLGWVDGCDLMLPNLAEARVLTSARDGAACARALAGWCGAAVVTLGAAGAVWSDGTRVWHAAPTAGPVVDTTGAGDAFAGGLLAAWIAGAAPDAALAAGTALAAVAVGRPGSR